MFITLDEVFHEDSMYFSSELELQGEYQKEIQTLDYDDHISEDVDAHISEDVGSLNTSKNVDVHIPDDVGRLDISKEGELSDIVNQEVSETLDQSSDEHSETEATLDQSSDEHSETEAAMGPPPSESLTPHQLLTKDVPEPSRNNVSPKVFLNPHMNPNFLVKLNIPRVIMCLTIVCLNQINHL